MAGARGRSRASRAPLRPQINSIQSILEQIQRHKASVALGSGNETTDTVQRRREAALAPQRRLDQQVDQLLRAAGPAGM